MLSRLQLLEELNRRYEGISPAVKTLLAERDRAVKAGETTNILGVLGELIEADLEDAGWIEGAMAGLDQVIVVECREGDPGPGRELHEPAGQGGNPAAGCHPRDRQRPGRAGG